ncbi:MAG: hypothetical protein AAF717_22360 [Bacteroidota bacterium]|nr:hypothetical protein [uncultured Allomuricauda sp.]
MKESDLHKGYNESVAGKRNSRLAMILVTVFCGVVTLASLVLYFSSNLAIADKVKVFDSTGREVQTDLVRKEKLLVSGIQRHVYNGMYYANSGDRNSLKENQARTYFLVDNEDALRIFNHWKNEKAYNDILQNGHIYKIVDAKVTGVDTANGEPFAFTSEATLLVRDGTKEDYWFITGEGDIIYNTPSYPYNEWGFEITNYTQQYQKVPKDE